MARENSVLVDKLKKDIEQQASEFLEKEKMLLDKCEQVRAENEELEASTAKFSTHIKKLNEYIDDLRKRNEEETALRKQFEAKLNSLHSVVRDQDTKYKRALEEIDKLILKNQDLGVETDKARNELS